MSEENSVARQVVTSLLVFVVLAGLWEGIALAFGSPNVPRFSEVASWIVGDWTLLGLSALATTVRALLGLLLAVLTGGLVGLMMSVSDMCDAVLSPVVNFLRPLPSSALILLLALWVSLSKVPLLVVWFGCTWPILLNTRDRMRTLPREVDETLRVLQVRTWERIKKVYSRALLPGLLDGTRVAVAIAVILEITVELIVPPASFFGIPHSTFGLGGPENVPWALGGYLTHFYHQADATGILAAVVMSGLAGVLINGLYHLLYVRILQSNQLLATRSA